jgi:UDP-N-acetylmuramyl pentapeptide phosphotransferase/UDP-N-acetylglucosamine-1-phosphate transferase
LWPFSKRLTGYGGVWTPSGVVLGRGNGPAIARRRRDAELLALPLICSSLVALAIAPATCAALLRSPLARPNYRGRTIACPLGMAVVLAALIALGPLALAQRLADRTLLLGDLGWVATFVLGVALLGLADDALAGSARGWRGHLGALRAGRLDAGVVKALGTLGLALFVTAGRAGGVGRSLVCAAVLALATNAFNLIDLRPGRALKALVVLGAALTIVSGELHPLWALGLFVGPVLVAGFYDLRERAMLGDMGAGILGALAGAWMVLTLSTAGLVVALAVLVALNVFGEFRSISAVVERAPILRHLDSLGRLHDALDA